MKKIISILAMVVVAWCCLGFISGPKYEVSYEYETVVAGGTLWEIAEKHYEPSKAPMCFEAFVYELKESDKNKKYFANGRCLQKDDEIAIPYFKEIK